LQKTPSVVRRARSGQAAPRLTSGGSTSLRARRAAERARLNRFYLLVLVLLLLLTTLVCALVGRAYLDPSLRLPLSLPWQSEPPQIIPAVAPEITIAAVHSPPAPPSPLPASQIVLAAEPVLESPVSASASPTPSPTRPSPIPPTTTAEPSATPTATVTETDTPAPPSPTPTEMIVNDSPILYYTQAGDTLPVVAVRYGVKPEEISSPDPIPPTALLNPRQLLIIPRRLVNTTSSQHLMPDSEVVYSPSAIDFDVAVFVQAAGGHLSTYRQYLASTGMTSGAAVVARVAIENSVNPRLLLSLLEYESGWVYGEPKDTSHLEYPMGYVSPNEDGLYHQLTWAVNQLTIGYYGWREGYLTEFHFPEGVVARLAPDLNAGTAALQYVFAKLNDSQGWLRALDPLSGFPALHARMFGDPWQRAVVVEPLYPPDLVQPSLILPFMLDTLWAYTGGPHGAWERDGAQAALDFAPGSVEPGCVESNAWTVAAASGKVVRSDKGVVVLDLDGDGHEQTGWVLVYLHVRKEGRIAVGEWVQTGDPLGHPSCEGGYSTGTHIHIARKYNGEWIPADGPMPFVLGGWTAHKGLLPYQGTLTRGDQTVIASTLSPPSSFIYRRADDP
jgi:LasA protease